MGFFQGILLASIFGGVGAQDYQPSGGSHNAEISGNFIGLAFLIASDQFIQSSFGQVLTIPVVRPIFIREVSNRMYGTTAYYMAMATQMMTLFPIYPIMVTLTSFWWFDLDEHSFGNML